MTNHPPSVLWHCWLGHQTCKNRRPYNLYCVGADVKLCSINQRVAGFTVCSVARLRLTLCHFLLICCLAMRLLVNCSCIPLSGPHVTFVVYSCRLPSWFTVQYIDCHCRPPSTYQLLHYTTVICCLAACVCLLRLLPVLNLLFLTLRHNLHVVLYHLAGDWCSSYHNL